MKPKGNQKETIKNGKMIKEKSWKKRKSKNLKQRVMGEKEKNNRKTRSEKYIFLNQHTIM